MYSRRTGRPIAGAVGVCSGGGAGVRLGERPSGGGRGGGHCLFEGSYPLPNYHPHFSGLSSPHLSLTVPYFVEL